MGSIIAKSILTKSKLPNVDFVINPYLGCTVGCKYCYARFMKRFSENAVKPWGTFVHWKKDCSIILSKEMAKLRYKKKILFSSVTDAYQPIERKLCITRSCLETLIDFQPSLSILSKCALICRDIDLIRQFDDIEIGMSISSFDENVSHILEPYASPPSERLQSLQSMKKYGIKTYAFIGPIHPYLSNIKDILYRLSGSVDCVMAEVINIRCGNWGNLSNSLCKTDISVDRYREIAKDKEWIDSVEFEYNNICNELGLQSSGFFRH